MPEVEKSVDRKSYEQVCPMASALDFVGDRWTILILRELLGGPGRFQELKNGLPGIATNLLTERLRRMESDGIVRRLDAGGSGIYALTAAGASIRPAIEELGMWGARMGHLGRPVHQRSIRAISMAMQSILTRAGDALPTDSCTLELEVEGEHAEIVLGPRPVVTARPSVDPDARVSMNASAVSECLSGRAGEMLRHTSGDSRATQSLITALGGQARRTPGLISEPAP